LAPALDGLRRWQLFTMLLSIVLSQLLVNIWMYYSRGATCCDEIRALLFCDPAPLPCRGFLGDCADIPSQFEGMVFVEPETECSALPSPVTDYLCTGASLAFSACDAS
jgi:hypothetical protein